MALPRVLVVDDEKNIRRTVAMCLSALGCAVVEAATPQDALAALQAEPADLAFLDLRLSQSQQATGLDLLPQLLKLRPALEVVIITAWATVDTAVEALKRGARDYLGKPFSPQQIRRCVEQWQERQALQARVTDLESRLADASPEADLSTQSPRMQTVLDLLGRAASHDVPVLLRGESGTGKSVLARALHARSPRTARPFVVVNCPTLTDELLASELFGHARGAFTGAVRDQEGKVEAAEGGTLFLDEIAEISPGLQAKLLRFLQDKQFERVGETKTRSSDVRVVAATNRDLDADVKAGRFREDLLYRLNVVEVTVPSLRDRPEDVLALAGRFLAFFARTGRRATPTLSPAARQLLAAYPWPGNIRELRNALERAVIVSPGAVLEPAAFPERIFAHQGSAPVLGGDFPLDAIEREHILRVLARSHTQEDAAKILGVDASTLWRKKKKYGDS